MSTKQKGDISEAMVLAELLKHNYDVLIPFGDRLPYDIGVDINSKLIKIQVKTAWLDKYGYWKCSLKKTLTNSRIIKRKNYSIFDIDFIIGVIQEKNSFFIIPFEKCAHYKSEISLITSENVQTISKFSIYENKWEQIREFAGLPKEESLGDNLSNSGKP